MYSVVMAAMLTASAGSATMAIRVAAASMAIPAAAAAAMAEAGCGAGAGRQHCGHHDAVHAFLLLNIAYATGLGKVAFFPAIPNRWITQAKGFQWDSISNVKMRVKGNLGYFGNFSRFF